MRTMHRRLVQNLMDTKLNSDNKKPPALIRWLLITILSMGLSISILVLAIQYSRFIDVYTMQGRIVSKELPPPYNLPLLETERIQLSNDNYDQYIASFGAFWKFKIRRGATVFYENSEPPVVYNFEMPSFVSLEGYWQSESIRVRTSGAMEGVFIGTPRNESGQWGEDIRDCYVRVSPQFDVKLPLDGIDMTRGIGDRVIKIDISMSLTAPQSQELARPENLPSHIPSGRGFVNAKKNLQYSFLLVPLSAIEASEYSKVRQRYRISKGSLILLSGIAIALSLGTITVAGSVRIARRYEISFVGLMK